MDAAPHNPVRLEIHRRILDLIRSGRAHTRSDLVALLPASPSTVSLRTHELIAAGKLIDEGSLPSRGGRPSRRLALAHAQRALLVADLGTRHARMTIAQAGSVPTDTRHITIDSSYGPQDVLDLLYAAFDGLIEAHPELGSPTAICIGLPAPIDHDKGWVDSGSRLKGWHHFPIVKCFSARYGVPVRLENDADLMALGEHLAHPGLRHSVTVKAGGSIGCGVVINSQLHHGATGAAGDISHVRMLGFGNLPCACGKFGCLDTVVSGRALEKLWSEVVGEKTSLNGLLQASVDGNAEAIDLLRVAGSRLGEAMSSIAGLLNPEAVFLGGALSTSEIFLAAIRAALYANCHPLITRNLIIEATSTGQDAGLYGALALARMEGEEKA